MGMPLDDDDSLWPTPQIRGGASGPSGGNTAAAPRGAGIPPPTPAGGSGRATAPGVAVPGSIGSVPSRVQEYDTEGRARGAYEQYAPQGEGRLAIHDRTEELRRRLDEMAVA